MKLQCTEHKRSTACRVGLAALCAIFFMMSAAAFGQTAVDHFSNPRSSGFLQLVDGAGTVNFVRAYYADQGDYEERAAITATGQTAILASSVDEQINTGTLITHSIQIIGNHTLKLMCSGNGVDWYNFCDPAIGGKLSPAYNNGAGATGTFKGPYNGPVSMDFRSIGGGVTHLKLRWVATGGTTINSGDRVALTNEMANWESALNPVNGVKVDFDNSTAVVNVDPGYDTRGNIIGIYRSADGGTTWQYQGDMMSYPNGNFFQQDVTNGVQYRYGAERRDAYSNYSARVNASPGQATCDGRPGETRITADKGGGSLNAYWFPRTGTEVPCGSPGPVDAYRIYAGTIGQPESTFTFVQEIPYEPLHPTSWSLGYIPDEDVAFVVRSVRNGVEE